MGNRSTNLCPGIRCGSRSGNATPPHWKGPYTVVLTTSMAVKVAGVTPWIYHTRMKRTYHADPENAEWTAQRDPTDP